MSTSDNAFTQIELKSAIIRNPLIVTPETMVMDAIAKMSSERSQCETTKTTTSQLDHLQMEVRSSCVLVLENDRLVGIMTERDVVCLSAKQRPLDRLTMREVMAHPVFTLAESAFTDLFFAINLLQQHHIRHLPILGEDDRVVGIVTHESLRQSSRPIDLLRLRLVNEVMTNDVVCAASEASMLMIAQMMAANRISSVMIVETSKNPSQAWQIPVGIVTERDIVQFQALGLNLENWNAATMMSSPIFAVKPDDSLWMVHQIMEQRFISRLAVVGEQGELLGIVTQTSLLQALNPIELYNLAEILEKKVARLEAENLILLQDRNAELEQQQRITYQQLQEELSERQKAELALQELNQSLEVKIKERTKALHSSEAQIHAMLQAIPDLLLRVTRDGSCLKYVNPQDSEERFLPIQYHLSEVLSPDLLRQQLAMIEQATATGELQVYEQQSYKDDRLISEEVRIVPISSDEVLIIMRDDTDRKRAEESLQASETRFRRVFESNIVGMMFTNLDGQITDTNDRFLEMLGYSREDMNAKHLNWETITPPEYLLLDLHAIQHLKHSRVIEPWEKVYYHKDGHSVHVLIGVAMLSDEDCVCVVVDISDRKQAEDVIRQQVVQETLLREITQRIRQSLDLQTIFDTACQEIRVVLQADRVGIFKFDPDSGFDDGKLVAESVVADFPSMLAIPIHDHCFGEKYAPLYLQGRYAAMSDIHQLYDQCHIDVLAQFKVRANLVMPLFYGEQLWGLLCIHQCESPRHWTQLEIDFTQQISIQLGIAIQQASLFEQLQQELCDRQLAEQQLTERNQQLAISNEELARATRLKDEFLANMSHELRTPLNAILGMTEGMQDNVFGEINESQLKALQTIERSGSHLLELINDILDVAKIESGQLELEYANTSIEALCQSSLAFVKQQALKKRIQLETKLQTNLPNLNIDERRIRQVLINLLSNAVKFTPEGGRITLEVSYQLQRMGSVPLVQGEPLIDNNIQSKCQTTNYLQINIIDTGIGIAPQNIDKLFQPFIQIDSALNRQYQGTGLGLALVKRIVEMHGGKVGLTSEVGVGSCFMVLLPCIETARPHSSVKSLTSLDESIESKQESYLILIVEDNEANIMTVSSYLKAKGYQILSASNGEEAIALVQSVKPDLILMDIQMPVMDGLEAIKRIRQIPSFVNLPIIALTGLAMDSDCDRCLEAGANDYLSKPVKLKQLTKVIQQLLQQIPNKPNPDFL